MATIAECRVCGKPYKVCIHCGRTSAGGTYNWRRVACSPECGDIYLQRIIESRREKPVEDPKEPAKVIAEKETEEPKEEIVTKKSSRKKVFTPKETLIKDKEEE